MVFLKIPSPVSKKSQLHPTGEITRVIDVSEQLEYVYAIRSSVVGFMNSMKEMMMYSYSGKNIKAK